MLYYLLRKCGGVIPKGLVGVILFTGGSWCRIVNGNRFD